MLRHIFRVSSAVVLIIIGIAGLILPIIPGLLLIFIGVSLFLDRNPKILFKEAVAKAKERYNNRYAKEKK